MPDAACTANATPQIQLTINGATVFVAAGTSIAAALLIAGAPARISATGEPRAPLCGMGVCFECRVTIDGLPHQKSCQIICRPGMDVRSS
jgi:sarcosine oxidase subunit alpha